MLPLFTFLLQSPAVIDIESSIDQISPVNDFGTAFGGAIRAVLLIGAFLTFGYLIWGALDWILSQGDSGKVESARKKMTHAIIGLVLLSSVGAIFLVVQSFLGINILGGGGSSGGSGGTGVGGGGGGISPADCAARGGSYSGGFCSL